jgi:hypothetical protein
MQMISKNKEIFVFVGKVEYRLNNFISGPTRRAEGTIRPATATEPPHCATYPAADLLVAQFCKPVH